MGTRRLRPRTPTYVDQETQVVECCTFSCDGVPVVHFSSPAFYINIMWGPYGHL